MPNKNYTYKDVIEYFGGTTVKCELTGRNIDLLVDDYNIDHIIPVSRGGSNELDNMAFTIPQANAAKSNLTNEEFVALCKEVCENFGYEVIKKEIIN
jgi:CRISPR/Cas system Type II protein with McrA/HNH and RuvC-like nuclease domain